MHSLDASALTRQTGGNAFNATMTGDIGEQGTCTTCAYSEGANSLPLVTTCISMLTMFIDFSNYWTAAMYFKHQNGSYKRVPIYPNAQLGKQIDRRDDEVESVVDVYRIRRSR